MSPPLRAAAYLELKAERAQTHLDTFNEHVRLFLKEPYTVTRKDDTENRRHVKRYAYKAFAPEMGMALGEFLYCLHSGLDLMAWQLAKPDARRDQPKAIYFPIPEDLSTPDRRRNYADALKRFPDEVAKEIDALQPHKGLDPPESHPLWQLNKLSNLAKHRLFPIHSRSAPIHYPHVPGVLANVLDLEDTVEVSVPIEHKAHLDIEPNDPAEIQIGEWETDWALPVHRLSDIHGFITCTVIPAFLNFNLAALPEQRVRVENIRTVYGKK